jgi:hypothetical protein
VERVPEADPSVEAAVVPREATGAVAVLSPPSGLPVLVVEPPVASDVEMAEAPPLKVGDREPAPLAEEVPDAPAAGGAGALEEGGAEPRPVLGSGDLVLAWRGPNERRGERLRFWTCGASEPLLVLDDEREEQTWDELRECAEATVGVAPVDPGGPFQGRSQDPPGKDFRHTYPCDQGILCDAPLPFLRI